MFKKNPKGKIQTFFSLQSNHFKIAFFIILVSIAVAGTVTSVYYFIQYRALKANPNIEEQKEVDRVVKTLGKMMLLPTDETPTIATITDKDKLKNQQFFSNAENGDILLAYNKALEAIIYRPSIHKIIAVAPIVNTPEQETAQKTPTPTTITGPKIAYYNGTETIGLSGQVEKKILSTHPDYQTGVIVNAAKKDYKKTLVIDISGTHTKEANDIVTLLGATLSPLPKGEVRPDADILIISGK